MKRFVVAAILLCAPFEVLRAAEPVLFAPGVISTGDDESHPAFTPDGNTLYFIKNTPDFAYWTICESRRSGATWSEPVVAPFSGRYRDADPFVTVDGAHLLFISNRPTEPDGKPKRDLDIWIVDRTTAGAWSQPRRIAEINSDANEWFPVMTSDGTIYFGSEREGGQGGVDIWFSRIVDGTYTKPENAGPAINSPANEYEPYVTPDNALMIVAVEGRDDSLGAFDLYVSARKDGQWSALKNAGPSINSPWWDFSPKLSPDGKTFYFTSSRRAQRGPRPKALNYQELTQQIRGPGNGLRDIYLIDSSSVLGPRSSD